MRPKTSAPLLSNSADVVIQISTLPNKELVTLRAAVEVEMRKRGIALSVGAIGEELAIDHFRSTSGLPKLQHAPVGTKNVDALSRNGDRYSIKTICNAKKTGTVYPDTENKAKQLFEYLLIVRISPSWALQSIHQLSWSSFQAVRSWDKRMNAWYVPISARALAAATLICQLN
jgi:hypothetical protein